MGHNITPERGKVKESGKGKIKEQKSKVKMTEQRLKTLNSKSEILNNIKYSKSQIFLPPLAGGS
jgi:hypothetical protein